MFLPLPVLTWCSKPGACLSIPRGRERDGFAFSRGGADEVGYAPNEEATTTNEGKSVRSRRVGSARGVCGVARLGRGINHGRRRAPCIRSLAEPTRLTRNAQTGSHVSRTDAVTRILFEAFSTAEVRLFYLLG